VTEGAAVWERRPVIFCVSFQTEIAAGMRLTEILVGFPTPGPRRKADLPFLGFGRIFGVLIILQAEAVLPFADSAGDPILRGAA
jgi:hypothetical protein